MRGTTQTMGSSIGNMISMPQNVLFALERLRITGHAAFCVGGCVRDTVLGKAPHDWDITTSALPEETIVAFEGHTVVPTGLKHGTVTVLVDGEPLEITTFRIDGDYSDNRRPDDVRFTGSLREDLARRDFTMNALALDADGNIVDYFDGKDDINNKVVRCVGDPARRFEEDALRVLRAIRFASVLGFSIEEKTSKAIFGEVWRLKNVSAERINIELTKMLCGEDVGRVLRGYASAIAVALPEITPMFGFAQRNRHHNRDVWEHTIAVVLNSPAEPISRWAALLHDIGKPSTFSLDEKGEGHFYGHGKISCEIAGAIMRRLKFDNFSYDRIIKLIEQHDAPLEPKKATIKRRLSKFGPEMLSQLLDLQRADNLGQSEEYRHRQDKISEINALMQEIIAENECFSLRDLAISGNDVTALGFTGKDVGVALNRLLDAVIEGKIKNEREPLLEALALLKDGVF